MTLAIRVALCMLRDFVVKSFSIILIIVTLYPSSDGGCDDFYLFSFVIVVAFITKEGMQITTPHTHIMFLFAVHSNNVGGNDEK